MKRFTKLLSIALSAVMISSSMPLSAFAEEPDAVYETEIITEDIIEDITEEEPFVPDESGEDIPELPEISDEEESSADDENENEGEITPEPSEEPGEESSEDSQVEPEATEEPSPEDEPAEESSEPEEPSPEPSEEPQEIVPGYVFNSDNLYGKIFYPVDRIFNVVTQGYKSGVHEGIDLGGGWGSDVFATEGEVTTVQYWDGETTDGIQSYGNMVEITVDEETVIRYAHLDSINVQLGDKVKDGDVIGTVGQSGNVSGPHLHFEVIVNWVKLDPAQYITGQNEEPGETDELSFIPDTIVEEFDFLNFGYSFLSDEETEGEYGTCYGDQLSENQRYIYDALVSAYIGDDGLSNGNTAEAPVSVSGRGYSAEYQNGDYETAYNEEIKPVLNSDMSYAAFSFILDYPEMFWIKGGYSANMSIGFSGSKSIEVTEIRIKFSEGVEGYIDRIDEYNRKLKEIRLEIQNMNGHAPQTEYELHRRISEYICRKTTYNHEDMSAAVGHCSGPVILEDEAKVVCEGYAKAYKAILDGFHKDGNALIVGTAGGPHMWNYVKIEDKWYSIDVTWDDNDSQSVMNVMYFLRGSDGFKSHEEINTGISSSGNVYLIYPKLDREDYVNGCLHTNLNRYTDLAEDYDGNTVTLYCEDCPYSMVNDKNDICEEHVFLVYNLSDASCTSPAILSFVCNVCGFTKLGYDEENPAKGHTEVTDEASLPTCTAPGLSEGKHCSVCGVILENQTEISPTGHCFTDYESDGNAKCNEDGTETATCENGCGATDTRVVVGSRPDHTPGEATEENRKDPTCTQSGSYDKVIRCTECGEVVSTQEETINATGHTIVTDPAVPTGCTTSGKSIGYHCSVCGEVKAEQSVYAPLGHRFTNYVSDNNATCKADGTETATCENGCGATDTITAEGTKLSHTPGEATEENRKDPTCTENGLYDEVKYCTACGDPVSRQPVIIPSPGHKVVNDNAKEPTCTENGLTEGSHCSECGNVFTGQEIINANGHTEVLDKGTEATCTQSGLTDGKHCSVCSETIVSREVIPALGHKWDKGTVTIEPTYESTGSKLFTCLNDSSHTKTEELAKLELTKVDVPKADNPVYNGTVLYGISDGEYYTVTGNSGTDVGTYTATLTLAEYCIWSDGSAEPKEISWTISPASIATATVASVSQKSYTGEEIKPEPSVKLGTKQLVKKTDFRYDYENNINAGTGTATLIITGKGNYTGTITKPFTIKKATPAVTAPTAKVLTYTGSAQTLINAGKTTGGTMKYCLTSTGTYSTTIPKKTSVGIYKVYYKVEGNKNYNSTSAKYITVKIAPKKAVISSYANTSTGIKLTWGKVTGATGYIVYRDGVKIKTITSGSTVTYTDISDTVAKAANGKAFKYTVKAYYKNSAGTYAYGATSTAKTVYRVKAPATFTATAGTGYIKLTFSKVPTGMNYQIYRATSKTGTYSLIKTVSAGTTYYKNTGLTKGKTYYYKVRAYKTINSVKVYSAYTAIKYATAK
ncbi:MAG: peptidoglycan DD-metalloendopeptidase family protein [Clostridia bacterium]|nr:peptidoglycan DD-metalloendopeptidase family protein [Clostridia bacterium]